MTETRIPDKAESTAELGRLELRTQLFIDGRFRDAEGGADTTVWLAAARPQPPEAPGDWTTREELAQIDRGVPVGGELEYVDSGTLAQALRERRSLQP